MLSSVLRSIADEFTPAVLASSLSAEDMVLTHAIASARLPIGIFVLDTGRLNAETLNLVGEGEDVEQALAAFGDFSEHYQSTVAQPVPLFRRRLS